MTSNQLAYMANKETERSNKARESETNRTNLANEAIAAGRAAEEARHNVAYETEINRHNLASEQLSQLSYAETVRSNKVRESQSWASIANEQQKTNIMSAQLAETQRHNLVAEQQQSYANVTNRLQSRNQSVRNQISWYQAQTGRYQAETDRAYKDVQAGVSTNKAQLDTANFIANSAFGFSPSVAKFAKSMG